MVESFDLNLKKFLLSLIACMPVRELARCSEISVIFSSVRI
jgi:hypothetical protein